jgi:hypothetical protein
MNQDQNPQNTQNQVALTNLQVGMVEYTKQLLGNIRELNAAIKPLQGSNDHAARTCFEDVDKISNYLQANITELTKQWQVAQAALNNINAFAATHQTQNQPAGR